MFPWEQAVPESCSESASNVCPELSSNPPGLFPYVKNWAIQYLPPRFVARSVSMSVKHLDSAWHKEHSPTSSIFSPCRKDSFFKGKLRSFEKTEA